MAYSGGKGYLRVPLWGINHALHGIADLRQMGPQFHDSWRQERIQEYLTELKGFLELDIPEAFRRAITEELALWK